MAVEKKPVKQPVEKTVVKVSSGESTTMKTKDERRGAAKGKRIAAVVFWLLAIVCEVLAIMVLSGYMYVANPLLWLCIFIVADLALVITGSQFWKKANDVDPVSKQNKVKFFLWNQMKNLTLFCLLTGWA